MLLTMKELLTTIPNGGIQPPRGLNADLLEKVVKSEIGFDYVLGGGVLIRMTVNTEMHDLEMLLGQH